MGKYYEAYKTLITACAFLGVYLPSIEKIYGRKWYIRSLKSLLIVSGATVTMYFGSFVIYLLVEDLSKGDRIFSILLIVYSFFTNFTLYSFYCNRHQFDKLFQMWDAMFQQELFPEERQEWLSSARNLVQTRLKAFGACCILLPLAYNGMIYFNPDKKLDHPLGIPYKHESPEFELTNTFDLLSNIVGFFVMLTYDTMMMVFLSLEERQLLHLKRTLARIMEPVERDPEDLRSYGEGERVKPGEGRRLGDFEEVERKVRIWIRHHTEILRLLEQNHSRQPIQADKPQTPGLHLIYNFRFHEELQKVYYIPLSLKFMVFVLLICLCSFLAVSGSFSTKDTVMASGFCCTYYSLFYVNVRLADSITEIGAGIFEEAFSQGWYWHPRSLKENLKIVLLRSNRPVRFVAFKIYPLSSANFLRILSSAYSFFMFLLQVNNERT